MVSHPLDVLFRHILVCQHTSLRTAPRRLLAVVPTTAPPLPGLSSVTLRLGNLPNSVALLLLNRTALLIALPPKSPQKSPQLSTPEEAQSPDNLLLPNPLKHTASSPPSSNPAHTSASSAARELLLQIPLVPQRLQERFRLLLVHV